MKAGCLHATLGLPDHVEMLAVEVHCIRAEMRFWSGTARPCQEHSSSTFPANDLQSLSTDKLSRIAGPLTCIARPQSGTTPVGNYVQENAATAHTSYL